MTMKPPDEIELHTEPPRSLPFYEVLRDINQRPDGHCEFAWHVFDEMMPGDHMDTISKFASLGLDTATIWASFWKSMPEEARNWKPRMHEMVCLSIERAVRKAALTNEA